MRNFSVLIPAYRPGRRLVEIVSGLSSAFSGQIVVVDDGSGVEFSIIFAECASIDRTIVLRNAVNLGKGAALKHGINYILTHFEDVTGIVTADADGQHLISDIVAIAEKTADSRDALVLGAREFNGDVPFRSRFGNSVSKVIYRGLLGLKLQDTQTGLRGLSPSFARACLAIRSNRYEFETEQLSLAAAMHVPIREVTIQTVYEDHNASSHFNPLLDSARIYFVVLRYAFSSIATTVVDLGAFLLLLPLLPGVVGANLASRTVAMGVQFLLLKKFVFKSEGGLFKFLLFVAYVALTGLISGILQRELSYFAGTGALLSKLLIETLIFTFNFLFLRDIMFRKKP